MKGKELILPKAERPLVKLVSLEKSKSTRTPGFLKGHIKISANFDAPLPQDWVDDSEDKQQAP